MANNTVLNVGVGGDTMRDLDRSGVKTQIVAIDLNPAGAETLMAGAMPVSGAFWQATQPVSIASTVTVVGAVSVSNFPTGFLAAQSGTWNVGITGSVAVTGTFWQATQPVSGTFWQATQPVSLASNVTVVGTGTFLVQAAQSGTWNIGTVTTITNALPAGTNLLGRTASSDETGTIYSGTTALTPKFAFYSTSSAGALTVVPVVSAKKIRVLRWRNTSNGTTNVKWQSHVSGDISGLSYCTQFKDVGGGYCPVGHFETVAGEALDINNSAAVAISGEVTYIEV